MSEWIPTTFCDQASGRWPYPAEAVLWQTATGTQVAGNLLTLQEKHTLVAWMPLPAPYVPKDSSVRDAERRIAAHYATWDIALAQPDRAADVTQWYDEYARLITPLVRAIIEETRQP